MSEYAALDLFCGAGGASLGIERAGFDLVAGIDQNKEALNTHKQNLPSPVIQHDLFDVDPSVLPNANIDYIHGSPPCKGFSSANKQRNINDERNNLVFRFIEWVSEINPKVVSMENVTGMLNITSNFMERVLSAFSDIGYNARYKVLNAAKYGVAQERERVYTIAFKEGITPNRWFPTPTHAKAATNTFSGDLMESYRSVRDVIGDSLDIDDGWLTSNVAESHQKRGNRPLWCIDRPSQTVTGSSLPKILPMDNNNNPNWEAARKLTINEFKRIQSFPSGYEFRCSDNQAVLQIGNAVPPRLQENVASNIISLLSDRND